MRTVAFYIVVFALTACSANTKKSGDNTTALTEVTFAETIHDFGKVEAGEVMVYSFVFINQGPADFIFSGADCECGCVEVFCPQPRVKPGEKGRIDLQFDTSGLIGKELKNIKINSNCKEPKQLVIFAEIENKQIEIHF